MRRALLLRACVVSPANEGGGLGGVREDWREPSRRCQTRHAECGSQSHCEWRFSAASCQSRGCPPTPRLLRNVDNRLLAGRLEQVMRWSRTGAAGKVAPMPVERTMDADAPPARLGLRVGQTCANRQRASGRQHTLSVATGKIPPHRPDMPRAAPTNTPATRIASSPAGQAAGANTIARQRALPCRDGRSLPQTGRGYGGDPHRSSPSVPGSRSSPHRIHSESPASSTPTTSG